jgi:hypothetical protein
MNLSSEKIQAFSKELEKLALDLDAPTVMGLLGGGAAGYGAYQKTRDPRAKLRNAILAALVAGGGTYGITKHLQGEPSAGAAPTASPPRTVAQIRLPARPQPRIEWGAPSIEAVPDLPAKTPSLPPTWQSANPLTLFSSLRPVGMRSFGGDLVKEGQAADVIGKLADLMCSFTNPQDLARAAIAKEAQVQYLDRPTNDLPSDAKSLTPEVDTSLGDVLTGGVDRMYPAGSPIVLPAQISQQVAQPPVAHTFDSGEEYSPSLYAQGKTDIQTNKK